MGIFEHGFCRPLGRGERQLRLVRNRRGQGGSPLEAIGAMKGGYSGVIVELRFPALE